MSDCRIIQRLSEAGFITHRAIPRKLSDGLDLDALVENTYEMLVDWHESVLDRPRNRIFSFDWTYSKNFNKNKTTVSPVGFGMASVHLKNTGKLWTDAYSTMQLERVLTRSSLLGIRCSIQKAEIGRKLSGSAKSGKFRVITSFILPLRRLSTLGSRQIYFITV